MAVESNSRAVRLPPGQATRSVTRFPTGHVHGERVSVASLGELAEYAQNYVWAPGNFRENYREKKNFEIEWFIGLDFDDGRPTLKEAETLVRTHQLAAVILTTRNHQKEKKGKPPCDRFRVVVELAEPITTDADHRATWAALVDIFGGGADSQAQDPSRYFFASPGLVRCVTDGKPFAVVHAPPPRPKPPPTPRTPLSDGWAQAAFDGELERMRRAAEGERNGTLNRCAFALAQVNAGGGNGRPFREEAEAALATEALASGLEAHEVAGTFESGWAAGLKEPRFPPERPQPPPSEEPPPHTDADASGTPPRGRGTTSSSASTRPAVPPPLIGPRVVGWRTHLAIEIPRASWLLKWEPEGPGFFRNSGVVVFAGPPGQFKSSLNFSTLADLAAIGVRVGLVEIEGDEDENRQEVRRAIGSRGVPDENFLSARYDNYFQLMDRHYRNDLIEHMRGRVDILALDSLPKMTAGLDENSPLFSQAVSHAEGLANAIGARLLSLIAHTIKTTWRSDEEPCLADIRGHGSLAGVLDAAYIVRRAKGWQEDLERGTAHLELWNVKRRGGGGEHRPLDVMLTRTDGGLEKSWGWLKPREKGTTGRKEVHSAPELDAALLSYARNNAAEHPRGYAKSDFRAAVAGSNERKDAAIERLATAGSLLIEKGRFYPR